MADFTVSSDVDTMLQSADNASIKTNIGAVDKAGDTMTGQLLMTSPNQYASDIIAFKDTFGFPNLIGFEWLRGSDDTLLWDLYQVDYGTGADSQIHFYDNVNGALALNLKMLTGRAVFGYAVDIQSNIDSTSTTTGALTITGGAGIGTNLHVGQEITTRYCQMEHPTGEAGLYVNRGDGSAGAFLAGSNVVFRFDEANSFKLQAQPRADLDARNFSNLTNVLDITKTEMKPAVLLDASAGLKINTSAVTLDGIIDDDSMATASATTVSTSESVKAYVDAGDTIGSVTTGEPTGSDQVLNVVSLTQAEYDAGTPVATTLYVITDA